MCALFAKAKPTRTRAVDTADGLHRLHMAEYGRASASGGVPIVYLHGGPGGGIPPDAPRLFDPETFHIVVFDQRGCGLSSCADRLQANTTDLLVEDVETVRVALGIEQWIVMGSSYGSLLSVLYALRHPSSVRSVLVHGVFLGSHAEIAWLFEPDGAARFYPQQWANFEALGSTGDDDSNTKLAKEEVEEAAQSGWLPSPIKLVVDYHRVLAAEPSGDTDNAELMRNPLPASVADNPPPRVLAAAKAMALWEDDMETLAPMPATHDPAELISGTQIAAHFFYHGCYLPDDGLLPELARAPAATLAAIPLAIIHGRHDVICPPRAAAKLHAAWPKSSLRIVEGGAHALFEKPMRAAAQAALAELTSMGGALDGANGKRRRT